MSDLNFSRGASGIWRPLMKWNSGCPTSAQTLLLLLEESSTTWHAACSREGEKLDLDAERRVRTPGEMAKEAAELRKAFEQQHGPYQT